MNSPLTSTFIRDFHPLPVSDRRAVLKDLGVTGLDYRDDAAFFEWLADR